MLEIKLLQEMFEFMAPVPVLVFITIYYAIYLGIRMALFGRLGEKRYKALIPIYGTYTSFKMVKMSSLCMLAYVLPVILFLPVISANKMYTIIAFTAVTAILFFVVLFREAKILDGVFSIRGALAVMLVYILPAISYFYLFLIETDDTNKNDKSKNKKNAAIAVALIISILSTNIIPATTVYADEYANTNITEEEQEEMDRNYAKLEEMAKTCKHAEQDYVMLHMGGKMSYMTQPSKICKKCLTTEELPLYTNFENQFHDLYLKYLEENKDNEGRFEKLLKKQAYSSTELPCATVVVELMCEKHNNVPLRYSQKNEKLECQECKEPGSTDQNGNTVQEESPEDEEDCEADRLERESSETETKTQSAFRKASNFLKEIFSPQNPLMAAGLFTIETAISIACPALGEAIDVLGGIIYGSIVTCEMLANGSPIEQAILVGVGSGVAQYALTKLAQFGLQKVFKVIGPQVSKLMQKLPGLEKYASKTEKFFGNIDEVLKKNKETSEEIVESGTKVVSNAKLNTGFDSGQAGEIAMDQLIGGGKMTVIENVHFTDPSTGLEITEKRVIDRLKNDVAHESKVGYASKTKFIQKQVAKDLKLLQKGDIEDIQWHFFKSSITGKIGPSQPLRKLLEDNGIKVIIHDGSN
ncbi:MAG: hypothetical protein RR988_05900 [Clostridia bacterium]